jgi:sporulation protein YlmC with PRC-barrel domain
MRLSDEKLRGMTVIGADGQAIGEVAALFVVSDGWRVESIKVKLRNEIADRLGSTRSVFHAGNVEIPMRVVQSISDTVVLTVGVDDLREVLPSQPEVGGPAVP